MLSSAPSRSSSTRPTGLNMAEQLNAIKISKDQLEAALRSIASLPAQDRSDPAAQAMLLQAFLEREKIEGGPMASAAIHARVVALDKWIRDHDPQRQSNAEAVIDAASSHRLTETVGGLAFDPISFSELVLFVEELPF